MTAKEFIGLLTIAFGVLTLVVGLTVDYSMPMLWWLGSLFIICVGIYLILFGEDGLENNHND